MAWYNREVFAPDIEYEPEGEEPYTQPSIGQDGAQHMLKYIHDYYPTGGALTRFDQAFGAGAAYPRRQYDLYLQNGNLNYIEFKSYKQTTYFGNAKDVEQLLSYLSRVNNLSELRYVFNAKKLSPQQAKEKMQGVFRGNAQSIFDKLEAQQSGRFAQLFNAHTLNGISIQITNAQQLQQFCATNNPDCIQSSLFNFVITN